MPDPAAATMLRPDDGYTTQLQAAFYDEAERLYVEEGLSPQAIHNRFAEERGEGEAPSRRTVYNWMTEGDWKARRRRWLSETEDIGKTFREAIRVAAREAIANPNRDAFSALRNAVSGAKMWEQLQGIEQAAAESAAEEDEDRDEGEVARDALAIVKEALEGK